MTEVKKETNKRFGNSGPNKKNHTNNKKPAQVAATDASFKGGVAELDGFYFDFMPDTMNGERFEKTLEAMVSFVGRGGGGDFKNGNVIARALEDMTPVVLTQPQANDAAFAGNQRLFNKAEDQWLDRVQKINDQMQRAYSVIYGQCTPIMKAKLQSTANYTQIRNDMDAVGLLVEIRRLCFNYQSNKYVFQSSHESLYRFYTFRQDNMGLVEYYEKFQVAAKVAESCGVSFGLSPELFTLAMVVIPLAGAFVDLDDAQQELVRQKSRDMYLGTAFILMSDRRRTSPLIDHLQNKFLEKSGGAPNVDTWPQSLVDAYHLLLNWRGLAKGRQAILGSGRVAFTTTGDDDETDETGDTGEGTANATKGSPKKDKAHIKCWNCKLFGHYANECPKDKAAEESKADDAATEQAGGERGAEGNLHVTTTTNVDDFADISELDFGSGFMFTSTGSIKSEPDVIHGKIDSKILLAASKKRLPPYYILLDNQANLPVFYNEKLLTRTWKVKTTMRINSDGGVSETNWKGWFPGYGEVWLHREGIANILPLCEVKKMFRVTYDSDNGDTFTVHKRDGVSRKFVTGDIGLYYWDAKQAYGDHVNDKDRVALVTTVADKKAQYSSRDADNADKARRLQNIMGFQTLREFTHMLSHRPDAPVTVDDALAAEDIHGKILGGLKGKTVYRKGKPVKAIRPVTLGVRVMDRYREVILAIDVMKVNKIPFLITISRHIKFGTVQLLRNMVGCTMLDGLKKTHSVYMKRGFKITEVHGDNQFEVLRGDIAGSLKATLNVCSENEHVPEIERFIRTIKERVRCMWNMMPFTLMPVLVVVRMVLVAVFWWNVFCPKGGISPTMSPRVIVLGKGLNFASHCRAEFGVYVQTHEETDNTMRSRTVGAICLGPSGNEQGGHEFMNLKTGRELHRRHWDELPMPQEVIDRVNNLGRKSKADRNLTFTRRDNSVILDVDDDDDEDDPDYVPGDDPDDADDYTTDDEDNPDDTPASADIGNAIDDDNNNNEPNPITTGVTDDMAEMAGVNDIHDDFGDPDPGDDADEAGPSEITGVGADFPDDPGEIAGVGADFPDDPGEIAGVGAVSDDPGAGARRSGRERRWTSRLDPNTYQLNTMSRYSLATTILTYREGLSNVTVEGRKGSSPIGPQHNSHPMDRIAMTQYYVKKGLRLFGQKGIDAVRAEVAQLDEMSVLDPVSDLDDSEKSQALEYLMFLKEKRDGSIKGRGCADGSKQEVKKDAKTAPTVSTEALFLSCLMDATEGRDIATVDIPGAFMQADMDELVFVKFHGAMLDSLVQLNPSIYRPHVLVENGRKVLYARLQKALYGTVRAALLFWRDLVDTLEQHDFVLNPYDSCVMNKMIDGKQCTVLFHVDDLKISHLSPTVVTGVIDILKKRYDKFKKSMSVTRGKIHEYLGMVLDFSIPRKVRIDMTKYVGTMIDGMPDEMIGEATTPAASYLFKVNDDCVKLSEEMSMVFHRLTAQGLFLCARGRPDIETAIAFMTTRVRAPDKDDWGKLTRMMRYLQATKGLVRTLEADNMMVVKWYVDGAHAVHHDMRGHTGAAMTMGKGAVYSSSSKQKINTMSSTETELIGVNDKMGQILWTKYFLNAQGYDVPTVLFQDNKSTMLMENHGRASSTKRTRHINIRYFFVTDCIHREELSVEYCPTDDMLGDFGTKPLQGKKFLDFRRLLLNDG